MRSATLAPVVLAGIVTACAASDAARGVRESDPNAPTATTEPLAALAWLAGDWQRTDGPTWGQELWLEPRGGTMLGVNRVVDTRGPQTRGFEFLRITVGADGKIVYWASPGGQAPTPFTLDASDASTATFVNASHDFPQRIVYERRGDRLEATIVGTEAGVDGRSVERTIRWSFRRVAPD